MISIKTARLIQFKQYPFVKTPNPTKTQPNINIGLGSEILYAASTYNTNNNPTQFLPYYFLGGTNPPPPYESFSPKICFEQIATNQHNFNPTNFLGGGVIYPPPWVNPT